MTYWYADDSEFYSKPNYSHPDVFVFGGIICAEPELQILKERIEDVKALHIERRAPVKWNMKDLKSTYNKANSMAMYNDLMGKTEEVRRDIIEATKDVDFKIVVSAIESLCIDPKKLKKKKSELTSYSFVMGLMRYGLEMQSTADNAMVILDWPDKNDNTIFNKEYSRAYNKGKSSSDLKYNCGPLHKIGFNDSVCYTSMVHSTPMQFTDLTVGITKDYLQSLLKPGKKNSFKEEMFESILPKFRGYPEPFGKGLIISSNSPNLQKAVKQNIDSKVLLVER